MKKKLIFVFACMVLSFSMNAQAPNAIPYQGVARNAAGNILAAQSISLRISIHDVTAAGTVVFSETHSATTTALGLFNVNIGSGTPVTGTLAAVNWGNGAKFIQVEFDAAGGSNYTDMGTTQLNSVPYALYAGNATNSNQWTTNGNDISNSNSGNVGIGTNTPTTNLDITSSGTTGYAGQIKLNAPGLVPNSSTVVANGKSATPGNQAEWRFDYFGDGSPDNAHSFGFNNIQPFVYFTAGEKVGIGTGTPTAKLEVAGNVKIADGTEGAGKILTSDATGVASWQDLNIPAETDPQVSNTVTNQVAKWDGTSLVDGSITDDGGNIGIGNTSPLYKLDVAAQAGVSARMTGNLILDGSEGTFGTGWIGFRNTANSVEWDVEGGPDYFTIGKSNVGYDFTIANNGNVGIGTGNLIAPVAKLDVAGNIKITDGTEGAGKVLTSDATGVASWQDLNIPAETDPQVSNTVTNQVAKWDGTALTDGIITDDGNNIGIGNTSPLYKLDVAAQTGVSARMKGNLILDGSEGTFGTGWIGFRNTANSVEWDVEGGPDYFTIGKSNVGYDFTIANNGNVGIGTGNLIAPVAKLDVAGNIKITDGTEGAGKVLTSDATGVASWQDLNIPAETDPQVSNTVTNQVAKWDGTALTDGIITDNGTSVGVGTTTPNPTQKLQVNGNVQVEGDLTVGIDDPNAQQILFINGTGYSEIQTIQQGIAFNNTILANPPATKVGIGTLTPSAKLDVAGNVKIADGTQGTGKVLTSDANGVASWQDLNIPAETDPQVSNTVTNQVAKWDGTALTDGMITDNGTSVGVGTTTPNPTQKLQVNGNVQVEGDLTVGIDDPNAQQILFINGTGYSEIQTIQQGIAFNNTILANPPATKVGIGTLTPSAKLDVAGNVKIADGTQGTGKVLTSDANGVASWQDLNIPAETDPQVSNTVTNQVAKWDGTSLVDGSITDNGSNIGIGNTSPLYKLDVAAQTGVSARMKGNLILDGSEGTFGTGWIGFRNTTNSVEWDVEGGPDYFTIGKSNVGYDLTIANNGNVGIGTGNLIAPVAKLEVAGNVKIADGTEGSGKVLTSDASGVASWQNVSVTGFTGTLSGDVTGNQGSTNVGKINGVALGSTTATGGNILIGDGTAWSSTALTGDITVNAAGTTTIGAGKVTLAMNSNLAANSVIANTTGTAATPTAVPLTSSSTANAVVLRNAEANILSNNMVNSFDTHSTSSGISLTASSAFHQEFTGSGFEFIVLPDVATLTKGHSFHIINNSTINKTVLTNGVGMVIQNMPPGTDFVVTCINNVGNVYASWRGTLTGNLTGDVTGTLATTQLATTGVTAGTYQKVTVDAKGRVTNGTSLLAADIPSLSATYVDLTNTQTVAGVKTWSNNAVFNGTVKIADGSQGAGKVLTSDANGVASWKNAGAFAYGVVSSTGVLGNNYGITSVTRNSVGDYTITLSSTPTSIATVTATISDVSGWGFISAHYVGTNTVHVVCRNASSILADTNFNVTVFAP